MKLKSNPYLTILTIIFGSLLLNFYLESEIIYYSTLFLSGIAILSPKISKFIELLWFRFSYVLSLIIPNILLSLIFFLVLTPLAYLSKVFRAKSDFKSKNNSNSVFSNSNKSFNKKAFEKAW